MSKLEYRISITSIKLAKCNKQTGRRRAVKIRGECKNKDDRLTGGFGWLRVGGFELITIN